MFLSKIKNGKNTFQIQTGIWKIKLDISNLKSKGVIPQLAAIIVGENPASKLYVSSKAKTFKSLDCSSQIFEFPSNIDKKTLIDHINSLNKDKKFNGILVQLPLPKHLSEKENERWWRQSWKLSLGCSRIDPIHDKIRKN